MTKEQCIIHLKEKIEQWEKTTLYDFKKGYIKTGGYDQESFIKGYMTAIGDIKFELEEIK